MKVLLDYWTNLSTSARLCYGGIFFVILGLLHPLMAILGFALLGGAFIVIMSED